MSIAEKQQEIVDAFSMFEDWMEKYAYLIELGKELPPIDEKHKDPQHLVSGCQSRVWLHAERKDDGRIYFTADSDAVITKGIASLLIKAFSGHSPEEILQADTAFLEKIGLKEHLSPTRSNGLLAMIKQIRLYAKAFQLKQKKE